MLDGADILDLFTNTVRYKNTAETRDSQPAS